MTSHDRPSSRSAVVNSVMAALVFFISVYVFAPGISREPLFVDEAAFVSQSYFWDLAASGRVNDPLWLEFPAYDLPPLPKYLIGAALQVGGIARVDRSWALAWYANIHERRFLSDRTLWVARCPSMILGALGCVAIFAIGTIAANRRTGLVASFLLMTNPLYRLHAMRAMADIPAEAFILATSAVALAFWCVAMRGKPRLLLSIAMGIVIGVLAGLAVLSKLNGGLGLMIVASWVALGIGIAPTGNRKAVWANLLVMFLLCGLTSLATFVLLNPFVTAHPSRLPAFPMAASVPPSESPVARIGTILRHRLSVPEDQQALFPHNALTTPAEKIRTLAVQGFGRFGPLGASHTDSTIRYDWRQDWGAAVWLPLVLAGYIWSFVRGRNQSRRGEPATYWAIGILSLVSMITVGAMLPLAWDRYFLSIQAGSCLMAAVVVIGGFDAVRARGRVS